MNMGQNCRNPIKVSSKQLGTISNPKECVAVFLPPCRVFHARSVYEEGNNLNIGSNPLLFSLTVGSKSIGNK